ncbi:MAG TPA: hypothetical protein VGO93_03975 [Candidatus Xenobia bacterium]|jgi:tetratricopeptide (TPR) repeat protein
MFSEAILLGAALGATFGLTGHAFRHQATKRRWQTIHQLLEEGQPEAYLARVDDEVSRVRRPWHKQLLTANKAAGYVYLGQFEEAWGVLKNIQFERLPKGWRPAYVHNLLVTLIYQRRFDEARRLMERHQDIFAHPGTFQAHLDTSLAIYQWYVVGDKAAARALLTDLAQASRPVIYKVGVFYHLGLAAEELGDPVAAQTWFRQAAEAAPNHWAALAAAKRLR